MKTETFNVRGIFTRRVLAAAVGIILLTAAIMKSFDIELFMRQIKDYGIITDHLLLVLGAWGLIISELVLGGALLFYYRPRISVPISIALFCVFIGATLWAWITGVTEDCGCFGSWVKRSPSGAMIEDLVITGVLFLSWPGRDYRGGAGSRLKQAAVAISLTAGIILPVIFGSPVQELLGINRGDGAQGQDLFQLQELDGIDLERESFLFVLLGTDCSHCRESVKDFNRLSKRQGVPKVVGLSMDDQDEIDAFMEDLEPLYRVLKISEDDFFNLLGMGATPYTILVVKGRMIRIWDEQVPTAGEITGALGQ